MAKKKKTETEKPLTAEDFLAMDNDELHAWVEREFAERLAYYERLRWEEQTGRRAAGST